MTKSKPKTKQSKENWEKDFTYELDNVIEDMEAYTEKPDNLNYQDELFERLNKWGKSFISKWLSSAYEQGRKDRTEEIKEWTEKHKLSKREEHDGSDDAWNRIAWQINRKFDDLLTYLSKKE